MESAGMELQLNEDGQIIDYLSEDKLEDRPEERVRQRYLRILHLEYGYSKDVLDREVPIYYGGRPVMDENGNPRRADIAVYEEPQAKRERDQGRIRLVVETKAPTLESGHNQLVSYIFNTSANGAVWYNGSQTKHYRRLSVPENKLIPWPGIPASGEGWDAVGRRGKSQLVVPTDIQGLLRRSHNKLHRRGAAGDDITLDMVRIIIAKYRDEEKPGDAPDFYCTPEEYASSDGRHAVAERVKSLFGEFRDANTLVFDQHESIGVGDVQIAEVVSELQQYRLVSDDVDQWDVMGAVYEQYTADVLKKEGGEFFTNRLIVDLLVKMLDPDSDDLILDPAGGTGGFCTASLRYVRKRIRASRSPDAVKQRLIKQAADRISYIDIKHRLVKIAKTAMVLTGNGHQGCIQGDSLAPINRLDPAFLRRCPPGTVTRVLTNPPFAGLVNGRIQDPAVLQEFQLGKRWEWQEKRYIPTRDLCTLGTPPETLFLERCIEWLAPGGILGIVQPKGVLDTTEPHLATRHFIFRHCRVLAVVNCHKNTFQPYTGSRTTLLVLQKKEHESEFDQDPDYPIFMAVSRKVGQDSQGEPVFKKDEEGRKTKELDEDLSDIYKAWLDFRNGNLTSSEYAFSVNRSGIDPHDLNINPQRFLPSLNESLRQALQAGDQEGWSAKTIGEIAKRVSKGARFKREDLVAESPNGPEVVTFLTPGALLQERAENVKFLDLSRATEKRKKTLQKHQLKRGEILITRSGTIGRVILVPQKHDGHIGSDDLIRVEIENEALRYYVYGFLKTRLGQDQMKRNEYGTIQQHLEPRHIRDIVVPIPDDKAKIRTVAKPIKQSLLKKEQSDALENGTLLALEGQFGAREAE